MVILYTPKPQTIQAPKQSELGPQKIRPRRGKGARAPVISGREGAEFGKRQLTVGLLAPAAQFPAALAPGAQGGGD